MDFWLYTHAQFLAKLPANLFIVKISSGKSLLSGGLIRILLNPNNANVIIRSIHEISTGWPIKIIKSKTSTHHGALEALWRLFGTS